MTPENHSKLMVEVKEKMKAQLIDENIMTKANEEANYILKKAENEIETLVRRSEAEVVVFAEKFINCSYL